MTSDPRAGPEAGEWLDPREPIATWGGLLSGSAQLAMLEAAPLGYLLWLFP